MRKYLIAALLALQAIPGYLQTRIDDVGGVRIQNQPPFNTLNLGIGIKRYDVSPYGLPIEESDETRRLRAQKSGLCSEFRRSILAYENCLQTTMNYSPGVIDFLKAKSRPVEEMTAKFRQNGYSTALTEADVRRIVAEMLAAYDMEQRTKNSPENRKLGIDPRYVDAPADSIVRQQEAERQRKWAEFEKKELERINSANLVTEQMRQNERDYLKQRKAACLEADVCP
ncbi:MAG: hypothetical protein KJ999_21290 [Gammaproteobacteria bacterium]|nr:hypothetical protein [Gammaproteobacteria bacterium]